VLIALPTKAGEYFFLGHRCDIGGRATAREGKAQPLQEKDEELADKRLVQPIILGQLSPATLDLLKRAGLPDDVDLRPSGIEIEAGVANARQPRGAFFAR